MSAAEQTSMFSPTLPDEFVVAFRVLEQRFGLKAATLSCISYDVVGAAHWLHIVADGHDFVCSGRASLAECADVFFNQVHQRPLGAAATSSTR